MGSTNNKINTVCDGKMELQNFIKDIVVQLNNAVDEASILVSRGVRFSDNDKTRTIEFDIAITSESTKNAKGKSGIRVLEFAEVGGNLERSNKNSSVSRIKFGLRIDPFTKQEQNAQVANY